MKPRVETKAEGFHDTMKTIWTEMIYKTYMSFAYSQFDHPFNILLAFVDTKSNEVSFWAVPETIVDQVIKLSAQTLLDFTDFLWDKSNIDDIFNSYQVLANVGWQVSLV